MCCTVALLQERDRWLREEDMPGAMPAAGDESDSSGAALFHDSSEQHISPSGWGTGPGTGKATVTPATGGALAAAGGTGILSPSSSSTTTTAQQPPQTQGQGQANQGKKKNTAAIASQNSVASVAGSGTNTRGNTTNGITTGSNIAAAGSTTNGSSNSVVPSAVHTPQSPHTPMSAGIYSRLNTGG